MFLGRRETTSWANIRGQEAHATWWRIVVNRASGWQTRADSSREFSYESIGRRRVHFQPGSSEQLGDHATVDIGEPVVSSLKTKGQTQMIDAETV